jgi:hypothetical protein
VPAFRFDLEPAQRLGGIGRDADVPGRVDPAERARGVGALLVGGLAIPARRLRASFSTPVALRVGGGERDLGVGVAEARLPARAIALAAAERAQRERDGDRPELSGSCMARHGWPASRQGSYKLRRAIRIVCPGG